MNSSRVFYYKSYHVKKISLFALKFLKTLFSHCKNGSFFNVIFVRLSTLTYIYFCNFINNFKSIGWKWNNYVIQMLYYKNGNFQCSLMICSENVIFYIFRWLMSTVWQKFVRHQTIITGDRIKTISIIIFYYLHRKLKLL